MCVNERELHLLDHIELASILATQLGSKSEAILLRERVLRDAVAEKDELIHRQSKKNMKGVQYLFVGSGLAMDERTWSISPTSSFFRAHFTLILG